MKDYRLIHPDVDQPRGRTAELVEELARLWREGRLEGAGEIGAIVDLLTDARKLPDVLKLLQGGTTYRFLLDMARFLQESASASSPLLARVKKERGWQTVPLHVVGIGSATGALYAALTAAGAAGGEVITASFNYVGVPGAIVMAGATPRFVDVDARTWCMDPGAAARAVTKKTRAILITHVNTFADLAPWEELFRRRGFDFPLVQDASLAVASMREGLRPGYVNLGPGGVTVMSLTVSKIFSGLGGAIVTAHDAAILDLIYEIAHQGVGEGQQISSFGTNFKMSAVNAAIAHEQLRRRDRIVARRRELRRLYERELAPLVERGEIALQALSDEDVCTHFGVLLPLPRQEIAPRLWNEHRVQVGEWHVHHREPIYRAISASGNARLPATAALAERHLFLPFHTMLSDDDVKAICRHLAAELEAAACRPSRRPRKGSGRASKAPATARQARSPRRKKSAPGRQ